MQGVNFLAIHLLLDLPFSVVGRMSRFEGICNSPFTEWCESDLQGHGGIDVGATHIAPCLQKHACIISPCQPCLCSDPHCRKYRLPMTVSFRGCNVARDFVFLV